MTAETAAFSTTKNSLLRRGVWGSLCLLFGFAFVAPLALATPLVTVDGIRIAPTALLPPLMLTALFVGILIHV